MPCKAWYAIYEPGSLAIVSSTLAEVHDTLKSHPSAHFETFESATQAGQWLDTCSSTARGLTGTGAESPTRSLSSPRQARARASWPYTVPSSSPTKGGHQIGTAAAKALRRASYDSKISKELVPQLAAGGLRHPGKPNPTHDPGICDDMLEAPDISGDGFKNDSHDDPDAPSASESGSSEPRTPQTEPAPGAGILKVTIPEQSVTNELHSTQYPLSHEQQHILDRVLAGESIFFTGSAGTGKSVLLQAVIKALRHYHRGYEYDHIAVTASTGIAANNIEGRTLHSFAGVGLGNQARKVLIARAMKTPWALKRWRRTRVLIVDEISMVDARWFDDLEAIARSTRGSKLPFGGIQLVLCGDFFQLPPVPDFARGECGVPPRFAFQADSWQDAVPNTVTLSHVFRQKQPELIRMLNDMRLGTLSPESTALFKGLSRPLSQSDSILPTEIFPLRWMVEASNRKCLDQLPGDAFIFTGEDDFPVNWKGEKISPVRGKEILDRIVAPSIVLKIGAQVMCIRNIPESGLVNGSVGRVVGFRSPRSVRALSADEPRTRIVSDLEPDPDKKFRKHPKYEERNWPIVDYGAGERTMMGPFEFTSEREDGQVQAARIQVPLILAWALTVHKAQGQTIERVKVDLSGTFEKGQAYVALSRCTTLDGLEVHNFSPAHVMAHPQVIAWSKTLTSKSGSASQSSPAQVARGFFRVSEPSKGSLDEVRADALGLSARRGAESRDDEEHLGIQMYHNV